MPELGEATDPAVLVAGDPAALSDAAWSLRVLADILDDAADGLGRLATPDGWHGTAAEQFRTRFTVEPTRWSDAAASHRTASEAVDAFADELRAAQRQAGDAVALGPTPSGQALLGDARRRVQEAGDRAAAAVATAQEGLPDGPGFLADLTSGAATVAAHLGNGAASLGHAALRNPLDGAAIVGGGALAAVSGVGVAGGLGLTATGGGAIAGVPLGTVSAAGVATGGALAGAGLIDLALNAAGPDRVQPFQVNEETERAVPAFDPPGEITGMTKHGEERATARNGGVGVSDEAMTDAVTAPTSAPEFDARNQTYRYEGRDAVVVLNEAGKVVTTWPRHESGYRHR